MQMKIDIPDEAYNKLLTDQHLPDGLDIGYLIMHGIPLPKGHGRLKDVDAFLDKVRDDRKHACYMRSWTADDVLNSLDHDYALTIIPADGAESEQT